MCLNRVKWSTEIREIVRKLLLSSPRWMFPTIRSVYYRLGSDGYIPLTKQGYKRLNMLITKMRKAGEIPWGYFEVKRGEKSYLGSHFVPPRDYVKWALKNLKECERNYRVPLWYLQKTHVEIWIEKKGLLPTFEYFVSDLDPVIRAAEGYASWEFVYASVNEIKDYVLDRTGNKVVVLYFGDLDPSGHDIGRHIKEAIEFFGVNLTFKRVALLPEQVHEWGLPLWPERMEVIEKIEKDPRQKWYFERFGRIACELDAVSSNPNALEKLRELVRKEVEKYINKDILEKREKIEKEYREKIAKAFEKNRTLLEQLEKQLLNSI